MSDLPIPLVLTEAPRELSPSHRDLQAATEAARFTGFRIVSLPPDNGDSETLETALEQAPAQTVPTHALWLGFIPEAQRYQDLYDAARQRNLYLINTPGQHLTALEFDRAYPRIADLTPRTVVLEHPRQWQQAERLGYPLFLKGSVRSRKEQGWAACTASDRTELQAQVYLLFRMPYRTRGKVLARELVPLRHTRKTANGFPIGREFRVFLYRAQILGLGYYWDNDDPLALLTTNERNAVETLAQTCAQRLDVPFLAVDIGQTDAGQWIVIEVGDAQCAGYAQVPLLTIWYNLYSALEQQPPPEHNTP